MRWPAGRREERERERGRRLLFSGVRACAALGCDALSHKEMQKAGQVLERWQGFILNILSFDYLWDLQMEIFMNQLLMWAWS